MGHRNPDPARRLLRAELVRLPDLQTYGWYEYTSCLVDGDFLAGTANRHFYCRPLIWGDRKMSIGDAQAATEVRQATFCNIEDNFNYSSRFSVVGDYLLIAAGEWGVLVYEIPKIEPD